MAQRQRWSRDLHVGIIDNTPADKRPRVEPIVFTADDLPPDPDHSSEALVITVDILGVDVQRVMVDRGAA